VIVYDRTKTVVRRHVGRGQQAPLHPEALAFAGHYGFAVWLAAAYRPQAKGPGRAAGRDRAQPRAGRTVVRLAGRDGSGLAAWLPVRRAQVHRTHREVIAVRAERDRAALSPLPALRRLRPAHPPGRQGRPDLLRGQPLLGALAAGPPGGRVELRVTPAEVAIFSLGRDQQLLAIHPRAAGRGGWVVDEHHWDGLPDRATAEPLPPCTGDCELTPAPEPEPRQLSLPGISGWAQTRAAQTPVARRRLAVYDQAAGVAS
jgi:hypothetical protein